MASLPKIAAIVAIAFGSSLALAIQAGSVEILQPTTGGAAMRDDAGDLQILQNRIQRQQYQQRQQQLRDDDRSSIPLRQQAPQVPIIKPGCQVQVYGSNIVRGCR